MDSGQTGKNLRLDEGQLASARSAGRGKSDPRLGFANLLSSVLH
jgi:hypothetical protein